MSPFNGRTKLTTPYLDQTTSPGTPSAARSFGKGNDHRFFTLQTMIGLAVGGDSREPRNRVREEFKPDHSL